jgi:putative ABC transport system permease protein
VKRFKTELTAYPEIQAITGSMNVPGEAIQWSQSGIRRKDVSSGKAPILWTLSTDYDFVETYGMKILAGRSFDEGRGTDKKGLVINEEAARVLGFASPAAAVDQPMVWEHRSDGFSIIGVVQNFHQTGLRDTHDPLVIFINEQGFEFFSCRIQAANLDQTLHVLQQEYTKLFPGNPFDYFFLDEFFARQYETDRRFGQVFLCFTSTAIFLSCLGLVGLVSLVSSQRQKEIGIRKVLGATLANILLLLSRDFIKLVLLANLLAWPLAWWGMRQWLQSYAFRIDLSPWLFLLPSLLVLFIALLTVSGQTWRAARANPVESLRSE